MDEPRPKRPTDSDDAEHPVSLPARRFLQSDFHAESPDPDELTSLERVRHWCQEALDKRGKIAGLAAIARVADAYSSMDAKQRLGFYLLLQQDFTVDPFEVDEAVEAYRAGGEDRQRAIARLTRALDSPRLQLFRQFNTIPESIKFLVDLRADINARLKDVPELWPLEFDLRHLLESWFNLGFLQLHRITWDSPAALLEKLVEYEAVHEITNWMDLKRRLGTDRACFAFIHPNMPAEPIIFVEVALVQGISGSIQQLVDPAAPRLQPHQADTAIFYGITNAQLGLRGIPFGNMLIKQVTARLRSTVPGVTTFATLSPVPRFCEDFLVPALDSGELEHFFSADEAARLKHAVGAGRLFAARDLCDAVALSLEQPGWHLDAELSQALRPGLQRAVRHYLLEVQRRGKLACPVAHFHASNGAMLAHINWLGDTSAAGLAQSAGLMVNYLYQVGQFEPRQNEYAQTGRPVVSEAVEAL